MSTPTISTLMPVYNAERYVSEAVESILTQSFTDFEFIIVNDGSTDRSLAILESYAQKDSRIRLVSRPNTGLVVALNEMLSLARGPLLARMDADDISLVTRFEQQVAFLGDRPDCVAVGTAVETIDEDGDPLKVWRSVTSHEEIDRLLMERPSDTAMCHPSVMMKRDDVIRVGGYREQYDTAEDLDLFLRLAEVGNLANLAEILLKYRLHDQSVCSTKKTQQHGVALAVLQEAFRRRGRRELLAGVDVGQPGTNESLIQQHRNRIWWALAGGNVHTARKHAWRCLRCLPCTTESWKAIYCAMRGR